MTTQAHQTWGDAVEAAANAAERRRLSQPGLRGGTPPPARPGPLEFDARGFPIPQPVPSFMRRVARLLREQ
jgi:hypothetical protein